MNSKSIDQVSEAGVKIDDRTRQPFTLFSTVLEKVAELAALRTNHQDQTARRGNTQQSTPGSLSNLSITEKQRLGLHQFME